MYGLKKIVFLFASLFFLCFLSNALESYIENKEMKKSISKQFYNKKLKDIPSINEQVELDSLNQSALDYKFSHEKYANIN